MPGVIANMDSATLNLVVRLNGTELRGDYLVMRVEVTYTINRIPMAQVTVAEVIDIANDTYPIDGAFFNPGAEIEILAGYGDTNDTIFKGLIVKCSLKIDGNEGSQMILDCRHSLAKLTLDKKNEIFTDKTDSDIINALIGETGLSVTVEATSTSHKQSYQHHSTSWDYIMTRAEVNGMYLFVTPTSIKIGKPDFGNEVLQVEYGVDLIAADLDLDARGQYSSVSSFGWDLSQMQLVVGNSSEPTVNAQGSMSGAQLAQVLSSTPYHQFAAGYQTKDTLDLWSKARLTRSRLSRIQGSVKLFGTKLAEVGKVVKLNKLSQRFNGAAYINGVNHSIADGIWNTTLTLGLNNVPYYEEQKVSDLQAGGLAPGVNGLQIAIVAKLDADPESLHRIQVKFPVGNKEVLLWARLSSLYASNQFGVFFYPEVGDEVIVGFVNDDPHDAIVLGALYGKNAPPFTPEAANNTKSIVTRSKLKVTFDEEKKIITVETPGKNSIVLDDDKKSITLTDANKNTVTLDDKGITLDTPKDVTIKAKGKITMEATQNVEIKASGGDVKMAGININAEAQAKATVKGTAGAEISAAGQTVVKGAIVMIN